MSLTSVKEAGADHRRAQLSRGNRAEPVYPVSRGLLPLAIAEWLARTHAAQAIFIVPDEPTLEALHAALPVFLPGHRVLALPPWDCLPYDRVRPTRRVTGQRVASLAALADCTDQPTLVLTTAEALPQRVPRLERLRERAVTLAVDAELDPAWLRATLEAFGYAFEERVDEPGEAAIRAGAVDIYPSGETSPARLELDAGRVVSIRGFNPVTQRSVDAVLGSIRLLPASEAFTVPGEVDVSQTGRVSERLLPDGPLATLFDLMPGAAVGLTDKTEERISDWLALVRDSYAIALDTQRAGQAAPAPPADLYVSDQDVAVALAASHCRRFIVDAEDAETALPAGAVSRRAAACLRDGDAVIICTREQSPRLGAILSQRLGIPHADISRLEAWSDALSLEAGRVGIICLPLLEGFRLPGRTILVVRETARHTTDDAAAVRRLSAELRIGDMVVDAERGLARLVGLAMEDQAGAARECLSLEFLGGQRRLVPASEAGHIWRYGASGSVSADRLDGTSWAERRNQAECAIAAAAVALVQRLQAREQVTAPAIEPGPAYQRFVRRMPFAASVDQVRAIRAVRSNLAAGRLMNRLVCGDVGFGKTEIALHAAALAALAGHQVAVVAPTAILARQHQETFQRRLRGFDLKIELLIRGTRSRHATAVLHEVSNGRIDIVVGTHALLAARFKRLGLVVIDEEQRFGEAQKQALRTLQEGVHALVMTATPLPRSLQAALLNLVDVSLLTTPPAPRLPVRGLVLPFDPAVVRTALLREARRGGQSFVICPRIEDIAPMEARLRTLVPALSLTALHGRMAGDAMDEAMMKFASGERDVLLATNIVEAGLDLPNANTMLIWHPERFGLAQLHQLRGRVGRGRVRASAYLLTDPEHPPSEAARRRLETVAGLDSLGAGFGISLADLDQRGAGNLLGEEQAGHIVIIGTERFQHVLRRALAAARGEPVPEEWTPEIVIDLPSYVPADFVPEPDTRLDIYRRFAGLETLADLDEAREDLADRFGALPPPVEALVALTRLRLLCLQRGIAAVHVGPAGVALTPRAGRMAAMLRIEKARRVNERVILPGQGLSPAGCLHALVAAVERMGLCDGHGDAEPSQCRGRVAGDRRHDRTNACRDHIEPYHDRTT